MISNRMVKQTKAGTTISNSMIVWNKGRSCGGVVESMP